MKIIDGDSIRSQQRILFVILLVCLFIVGANAWQTKKPQAQVPVDIAVRERIATIITETLKKGELRTNGVVTVLTRMRPSNSAIREVKEYGDAAVPVLNDYLQHSENESERELALRLLGSLGGRRIVAPLREIIRYDSSRSLRQLALLWITQAPWNEASPVIREAAETDPDEEVRQEAKSILGRYAPK